MIIPDRAARVNKVANGKLDRNAVLYNQIVSGNYSKTLGN